MLASRFAVETRFDIAAAGDGSGYDGPPRLVSVARAGVALNGAPIPLEALPLALDDLSASRADMVILRSEDDASVQRVVETLDVLRAAGFGRVALIE